MSLRSFIRSNLAPERPHALPLSVWIPPRCGGGGVWRPRDNGRTLRGDSIFPILPSKLSFDLRRHQVPVTLRNLSEEIHRALKLRATHHGRNTEAEMPNILESAVLPAERLRLGSALSALSRKAGLTNADFEALEQTSDKSPPPPMSFE